MKTIVTVEEGQVTVQVDDGQPIHVTAGPPVSTPPTPDDLSERTSTSKTPAHKSIRPNKALPALPAKIPTSPQARKCEVCGDDIGNRHKLTRICQKPECINAKRRLYNENWRAKSQATAITKPSNKAVPYSRTTKPDEAAEVKSAMEDLRANFDDPWNCNMCRNAGSLCTMHERMTAKGEKPPRFWP